MRQFGTKSSPDFMSAFLTIFFVFQAPLLSQSEEISLTKDRKELESLREQIPAEKKIINDERAFLDELFANESAKPFEIRSKFNKELQKKREQFSKSLEKERKEFTAKTKDERDRFQKQQREKRDLTFKSTKDSERRKEVLAEFESERVKFNQEQKDRRDSFEQEVKSKRNDFNDKVKSTTEIFNQRLKAFTEKQEQIKKDQKLPSEKKQVVESWKNVDQQFEHIKKKSPVDLNQSQQ
ncbi:MAG: hypothetical protein ACLGGX_07225 [Bdellovibrionia bacterium]